MTTAIKKSESRLSSISAILSQKCNIEDQNLIKALAYLGEGERVHNFKH